jgi:hypothetical protein
MAEQDAHGEPQTEQAPAAGEPKRPRGQITLKVSEKGGLSVYGLGRFPVTLYKEQWTRLLAMADDIRTFITDNDGKLKTKPE